MFVWFCCRFHFAKYNNNKKKTYLTLFLLNYCFFSFKIIIILIINILDNLSRFVHLSNIRSIIAIYVYWFCIMSKH